MLEWALVELESVDDLIRHLDASGTLERTVLQGLDLEAPELRQRLHGLSWEGSFLLGCQITPELHAQIISRGGVVFPRLDLPFEVYRSRLYERDELMQGYERGRRESLSETLDGRIYEYFKRHRDRTTPVPIMVSLALRIHDHAVDDALVDLLFPDDGPPLRVVGVMGGHGMLRTDPMYPTIVEMCRRLSLAGYTVATGGGPGAMEAANLGAYLVGHEASEVTRAVELLGRQPAFEDDAYLDVAYELVDRLGPGGPSLAIPTWYYGHEPTNLFASDIAKYFDNSLREEGLLAIARHGVVYAPGSAGTLQEVFMDTTQNHYGTLGEVSPMVFLGSAFWGSERPVIPLLEGLAGSRPYRSMIGACDSAEDAVRFILEHPPVAV